VLALLAFVQWIGHESSKFIMGVRFPHAGPIFLALALALPVNAKPRQNAPSVPQAQAVLLFDYKTNRVVEGENIHLQRPIASITKLMTAYVVLESRVDLDEAIKITQLTIENSPVLKNGTSTTRRDLLHLTLISSDNKAARLLAESHPGGYSEFIALMNSTAQSLGMVQTSFTDPSGLSVFNVSTAWDLHLLNRAINKYSVFSETAMSKTSQQQAQTRRGKLYRFVIRNTSALAGEYDLLVGKTGFTNAAKWCISTQVRLSGNVFDVIILGSPNKQTRNRLAKELIEKHISAIASQSTMFNIEQLDQDVER
jgi:D-alanyl-D-alanine endopeptidase (penicillin-binding protein 7)